MPKLLELQIDDEETAQSETIEEEVEVIALAADLTMVLPAGGRQALAELKEESLEVPQEATLEFTLGHLGPERQDIEAVRILDQLPSEVGLRRRQGPGKFRQRLALAGVGRFRSGGPGRSGSAHGRRLAAHIRAVARLP